MRSKSLLTEGSSIQKHVLIRHFITLTKIIQLILKVVESSHNSQSATYDLANEFVFDQSVNQEICKVV